MATVQRPTFVTHAPGDFDRIFVAEQDGRVTIIDSGVVLPTPFLDITELVYSEGIYPGLLGLAFHPQYQTNGFFYVVYHDQPDQNITLARYEVSVDPDIADQSSAHPVLSIPCGPNNNCVWIGFGPNDGYLYLASGDGGLSSNAQDLDTLLGKILRLDVDDDDFPEDPNRNYSYPPDNPFVGTDGADEIWAYGFRKPWRCSFDRETGDLYIGEVGTSLWEEVNFQPADSFGGENYGYGCMEGEQCTNDPSCDCLDPSLANPIFVYENIGGAAVIGGYVYRGCAISGLVGAYVVADYLANQIWQFRYDGQDLTDLQEIQDYLVPGKGFSLNGPLSSFGEDAFGELYICEVLSGEIYKIIPVAAPTVFDSKPGLPIPDADPVGVSDTINVGGAIPISSVWIGLDIEHTWVGDLCISVEHDGTVVGLIDRPGADTGEPCHFGPPYGCSGSNYDGIVLSDTGIGGLIEFACLNGLTSPPNYVPNEPLGAFAGMDAAGDWTITISDNAGNDLGALNSWSLMIIEQGVDPCIEPCSGDLDGNNNVGVGDLLILLGAWGPNPGHPADFDGNDDVGVSDLLVLLANWGPCP